MRHSPRRAQAADIRFHRQNCAESVRLKCVAQNADSLLPQEHRPESPQGGTMPRMANGDLLLLIRWPDPECAQRWPQSYPCSRAQIIRMLDAGEDIVV